MFTRFNQVFSFRRNWAILSKAEILQVNSDISTKGKDLSESGKQKPWTPFLLKIQILNSKWPSHLPMKEKTLGSH